MAVSDDQKADIMKEHLPYEVWMLNVSYESLCRGPDQLTKNVLIASFCIYARNVIDFFTEKSLKPKTYAAARHYIPKWEAFEGERVKGKPFYGMINEQTAHLSYARKRDVGKFGSGDEFSEAKKFIDREVIRFVDALPKQWREMWNSFAVSHGLYVGKGPSEEKKK
jgi:hypothetical protein